MNTKRTRRPVDLTPEPDLQEHQRLINRALVRNIARQPVRRAADNAATRDWVLISVVAAVLLIAAVATLFTAGFLPQ